MPRRVVDVSIELPCDHGLPGQGKSSGGAIRSGGGRRSTRRFSPYAAVPPPPATLGLSGPLADLNVAGPISSRTRRAHRLFAVHAHEGREVESLKELLASGPPTNRARVVSLAPSTELGVAGASSSGTTGLAAGSSSSTALKCGVGGAAVAPMKEGVATKRQLPDAHHTAQAARQGACSGSRDRDAASREKEEDGAEDASQYIGATFEYTLQSDGTTKMEIIRPHERPYDPWTGPQNMPGLRPRDAGKAPTARRSKRSGRWRTEGGGGRR
jgi:hypothetical protein